MLINKLFSKIRSKAIHFYRSFLNFFTLSHNHTEMESLEIVKMLKYCVKNIDQNCFSINTILENLFTFKVSQWQILKPNFYEYHLLYPFVSIKYLFLAGASFLKSTFKVQFFFPHRNVVWLVGKVFIFAHLWNVKLFSAFRNWMCVFF